MRPSTYSVRSRFRQITPFWDMPNVIMTPHTASMTPDFWDRLLDLLRENFIAFSLGQPMLNVIDKKKGY